MKNAERWILLYIIVDLLDELKGIATNVHWTDHAHHIASGIGYAMDLIFGTDRTKALAVMTLSSEAVSPIYQLYALLKARNWDKQSDLGTKAVVASSIIVSLGLRLPLGLAIVYVSARDCWCWATATSTSRSSA